MRMLGGVWPTRSTRRLKKGKTAFLTEQITKSKRMFFLSFSYSDLVLCQHSPSTHCVLFFLRLAETISKAKDIVERQADGVRRCSRKTPGGICLRPDQSLDSRSAASFCS